jgi:hypothetical protein
MVVLLKTDWAAISAGAAIATVVVYIVLGVFAWRQIREARRLREEQARLARESWAEQARQARELQEEQARPFVIVDLEPGFLIYLVVENIGRTMARNVTITSDKPFESTLPDPEIDETPLSASRSQLCRPARRSACCSTLRPPAWTHNCPAPTR